MGPNFIAPLSLFNVEDTDQFSVRAQLDIPTKKSVLKVMERNENWKIVFHSLFTFGVCHWKEGEHSEAAIGKNDFCSDANNVRREECMGLTSISHTYSLSTADEAEGLFVIVSTTGFFLNNKTAKPQN